MPAGPTDEEVPFLSDVFATGYMAVENADIQAGGTGATCCGPAGLLAIVSAHLLGAAPVIAIDRVPERPAMAGDRTNAETIDYARPPMSSKR